MEQKKKFTHLIIASNNIAFELTVLFLFYSLLKKTHRTACVSIKSDNCRATERKYPLPRDSIITILHEKMPLSRIKYVCIHKLIEQFHANQITFASENKSEGVFDRIKANSKARHFIPRYYRGGTLVSFAIFSKDIEDMSFFFQFTLIPTFYAH